ncbi:hypothetical protein L1D14_20515 [Vibrio tubiashii]|uniref:hypothetical protein n=1 Tax=Vibrio tubiashii TaxID=29498 RepID=UPI001EFDB120|nr:hypothetical protein [Vibrio tubiashii]MCG9578605.1 hypothetical protein [Vibrio tubiashii]
MKKCAITLAITTALFSPHSLAVVCTDPSGNMLHIQEMLKDAAMWGEEKAILAAEMAQEKAMSLWETSRSEYNASAQISATTTAISSTSNAAAEERYTSSPSACDSFVRAKALLGSMTDSCDNPVTKALFENNQSQIVDCGVGGTGLNCGRVDKERSRIANALSDAVSERDGNALLTMLDGGKLIGLSASPMQPTDKEKHDLAMSLLLGVETPRNLPRLADGTLPNGNDKHSAKLMSDWAREHVLRSVPNAALSRIKGMYDPTEGGQASLMAQMEERVMYYSSERFLKLLTNTNDKDLPSNWDMLTPEQKHEWNRNAAQDKKMTSSEQVIRMLGEMESVSLQLQYFTLESTLSTNALQALTLKAIR